MCRCGMPASCARLARCRRYASWRSVGVLSSVSFMGVPPKERLLLFEAAHRAHPTHEPERPATTVAASCRSNQSSRWRQVSDRAVRTKRPKATSSREHPDEMLHEYLTDPERTYGFVTST